ncbi:MAG: hypothetical protein LUE63_09870 [Lachnospiraceae bacterium]|nr:hypothetical protein [Lachnospiraceae bacterium]
MILTNSGGLIGRSKEADRWTEILKNISCRDTIKNDAGIARAQKQAGGREPHGTVQTGIY